MICDKPKIDCLMRAGEECMRMVQNPCPITEVAKIEASNEGGANEQSH